MPDTVRRGPLVLLLASGFVNMLGTTLTAVAVPLLTLRLAGGAAQLGLVGAAETAAGAAGIALGGPLVVRFGARRAAVLACLAAAALVAVIPLLAAVHRLTVPGLAVAGAAAALVAAPGVTARQDLLARGADPARIEQDRADALYWLLVRSGAAVGAPLAAVLLGFGGAATLVWWDAASFLGSALLLVPVGGSAGAAAAPRSSTGYTRQLAEGLRVLVRTPRLRALTVLVLVLAAADGPRASVLLPLYLRHGQLPAGALGWLLGGYTVGSLAGLGGYAWSAGRLRLSVVLPACLAATALAYAALGASRTELTGLAAMFAMGAAQGPFLPAMVTTVHARCPQGSAPTALGALLALTTLAVPAGTLGCALLVRAAPLPVVFTAIAALFAVAALPVPGLVRAGGPGAQAPAVRPATAPGVEAR